MAHNSNVLLLVLLLIWMVYCTSKEPLSDRKKYKGITGIIQLGAHAGEEAKEYSKYIKDKMIWIEAMPHMATKCHNNVKKYGQKCIQALIWNESGLKRPFYITKNSLSSSTLDPTNWQSISPRNYDLDTTKIIHLDTINYKDLTIKYPELLDPIYNYLLLDLQGAEYEALEGMGNHIQQFDLIEIEISTFEGYKNQKEYSEVHRLLDSKGFECIENCNPPNDHHGVAFYRKKGGN